MKKLTILAVSGWWPANSYGYLIETFAQLGHNVFRIGSVHSDHMGITWPDKDLPHPDILLPREAPLWNLEQFVDLCTDTIGTPDLLLVSDETYRTDIIPTEKVPVVLINYDSWPNCYERIEHYRPVQKAYITMPLGNHFVPRTEEDPRWTFLPPAYAPFAHKDFGMERDVDFVLYATMYHKRPEYCQALREHGFSVLSGQVPTDGYVLGHNRALTTYHNANKSEEAKYRWFEAMAMGVCVIADHCDLYARLGYQPMVHYIPIETEYDGAIKEYWPTVEAMVEKVRFLKEKPDLCRWVAKEGQKLTLESHSYIHRCQKILDDLVAIGAL